MNAIKKDSNLLFISLNLGFQELMNLSWTKNLAAK